MKYAPHILSAALLLSLVVLPTSSAPVSPKIQSFVDIFEGGRSIKSTGNSVDDLTREASTLTSTAPKPPVKAEDSLLNSNSINTNQGHWIKNPDGTQAHSSALGKKSPFADPSLNDVTNNAQQLGQANHNPFKAPNSNPSPPPPANGGSSAMPIPQPNNAQQFGHIDHNPFRASSGNPPPPSNNAQQFGRIDHNPFRASSGNPPPPSNNAQQFGRIDHNPFRASSGNPPPPSNNAQQFGQANHGGNPFPQPNMNSNPSFRTNMPLPNQATHWSNMPNSPPLQPGAQMPALGVNPIGGWRPLPPANQANAAQTGLTKTEQAAAQQAAERQVGQSALKPARALTEKVKPFEKNDGIFSGLTTSKELTDLASMGKLRLLKDTPTGQAIQMKPGDPIPHGSNVLAVSETGKVGRFSINEAGNIVPEASGRVSSSAQKELLKGQGIVPANAGGSSTSVGKGLLIGGGGVLTGAGVVGLSQLGNNNHGSNQGNWQGQNQGLNGGGRNGGIVDQAGLNGASNGQF